MVAVAADDELITATRVRAALSAPIELLFAFYYVGKFGDRHPDGRFLLQEFDPDLAQRAHDFWPDAAGDFTELALFAHLSGTLFQESVAPLIAALDATAASVFEIPALPGEDPEDEAIIRRHILELRADPDRRAVYVQLVRDAWRVLEPEARSGLAAGRRAVSELNKRLAAMPWRSAIPEWATAWCTTSEPLLDPAADAGQLTIVPMFLNERGKFMLNMPGLSVLSYVPRAKPGEFRTPRELAETIATRHKVVSDPTRLQLLGTLIRRGATVGELASLYDLSQPTVSVHMKQLRESGLVWSERDGAQVVYRTDYSRLRELLGQAAKDLAPR
jgi:DNA-binding transcriptional ArsR family regulator